MASEKPTHICEIPLKISPRDARILNVRFDCYRQAKNAAQSEALRRLDLMRESKDWQKARKMPKGDSKGTLEQKSQAKARTEAFNSAKERFGFSKQALFDIWTGVPQPAESRRRGHLKKLNNWLSKKMGSLLKEENSTEKAKIQDQIVELQQKIRDLEASSLERKSKGILGGAWISKHLGALVCQAATEEVWKAVEEYSFGAKGRPRFRGYRYPCSSVNSKVGSPLKWTGSSVIWNGLNLIALIPEKDDVINHSLQCRVKYPRIVRTSTNKGYRYAVQLVCEGIPYQKEKNLIGKATVGLDLGPSAVAVVAHHGGQVTHAELIPLAPEVSRPSKKIKALQRKLDRQRRANNPENFLPNGKIKSGWKIWKTSRRQQKTEAQLRVIQAKQASTRKSSHGRLVNQIMTLGSNVITEMLNYTSWQKQWGRSARDRAPGLLVEMLRRRCSAVGGSLTECSTKSTRLSRTCHGCLKIEPKPLSQRWHVCFCGVGPIQRDIYSAFLASCVKGDQLDVDLSQKLWGMGADTLLKAASSKAVETGLVRLYCKGKMEASAETPTCGSEPSSGNPANKTIGSEVQDVVALGKACGQEPGRASESYRDVIGLNTHCERRGDELSEDQQNQALGVVNGNPQEDLSQNGFQVPGVTHV